VSIRAFLDAILAFITCSSLTDNEFSSLTISVYGYDLSTYTALLGVLTGRESVSSARDRLRYYFLAKNVTIPDAPAGKSNVYIGDAL
jgi:hypothetical protein